MCLCLRMRNATRAIVLAFLAFLSAVFVGVSAVMTAITLAATTALIVPGTGTPKAEDVADYMQNAYNRYIASSNPTVLPTECTSANHCTFDPVDYPASFWPLVFIPRWCVAGRCEMWNVSVGDGVTHLDQQLTEALKGLNKGDKIVLFGYSQGARVVSIEKGNLGPNNPNKDSLEIVFIGNISRPNGGLWSRLSFLPTIPILDVSFGKPTPTYTADTGIKTTDISFEYDGVSDFPVYPLNLLAVANAIAGFQYVHGYYLVPNGNGPTDQLPWGYTPEDIQKFIEDPNNPTKGDTTYVTIPAKSLPILQPFIDFGNATGTSAIVDPILELIEPVLKVLIDTGYDRTANPGDPMTFRLIPRINPVKLAFDLIAAVGQGIKDATDGVPIVPTVTPPSSSSSTTLSTFALQRSTPAPAAPKPQVQLTGSGNVPNLDVIRTSGTQPDATNPGGSGSTDIATGQNQPDATNPGGSAAPKPQVQLTGSGNVPNLDVMRTSGTQPDATNPGGSGSTDIATGQNQPDATNPGGSRVTNIATGQNPFNKPGSSSVSAGQNTSSGSTNVTPFKLPQSWKPGDLFTPRDTGPIPSLRDFLKRRTSTESTGDQTGTPSSPAGSQAPAA